MRSVTIGRLLGHIKSSSNPNKEYDIRLGSDGVVYCSCTAWKMHKWCKHLAEWHMKSNIPTPKVISSEASIIQYLKDHYQSALKTEEGTYYETVIKEGIIKGDWSFLQGRMAPSDGGPGNL